MSNPQNSPDPSISPDTEEYNVEAIRAWRYNKTDQRREYLIKWENYREEENTWEPEEYLDCPDKLKEYLKTLCDVDMVNHSSTHLDSLSGFERHATYIGCVGAARPHDEKDKNPFYCLIQFEDSEDIEEVYFHEFYNNLPEEALDFLECRLIYESALARHQ